MGTTPFLTVLVFILTFGAVPAFAAVITFQWDANNEPDFAGYRLYQSNVPEQYTYGPGNEVAEIPSGTETVTITVPDGTWYWVLTAYNDAGESDPSDEVSKSVSGDDSSGSNGGCAMSSPEHAKIPMPLLRGGILSIGLLIRRMKNC